MDPLESSLKSDSSFDVTDEPPTKTRRLEVDVDDTLSSDCVESILTARQAVDQFVMTVGPLKFQALSVVNSLDIDFGLCFDEFPMFDEIAVLATDIGEKGTYPYCVVLLPQMNLTVSSLVAGDRFAVCGHVVDAYFLPTRQDNATCFLSSTSPKSISRWSCCRHTVIALKSIPNAFRTLLPISPMRALCDVCHLQRHRRCRTL